MLSLSLSLSISYILDEKQTDYVYLFYFLSRFIMPHAASLSRVSAFITHLSL